MPYYQDAMIFTGIGGEYTVIKRVKNKGGMGGRNIEELEHAPKKFVLMQPDSYVSEPEPIF